MDSPHLKLRILSDGKVVESTGSYKDVCQVNEATGFNSGLPTYALYN